MSDYLCYGWKQIARVLTDIEGNQLFTADHVRKKFGRELKECAAVFELQVRRGERPRVCAWASKVRLFFELRGRFDDDG